MKRVELSPGYTISRIIKGCWQFSEGHSSIHQSADSAVAELCDFAEAGITTFDGADIYAGVEELFGKFRKEYAARHGRAALRQLQFHTKFVPDLNMLPQMNRMYVERIIDRSLSRIGTDTLDLVQFHWWDWVIPRYIETAGFLVDLQKAGKIRHLGVTNFDVLHLRQLLDAGIKIVSNQVQYSLLDRRPENGITKLCAEQGVHLLAYGTLAGGFLSETWLDLSEPSELNNRSLVKYRLIIEELGSWAIFQELLRTLYEVGKKHNLGIAQVSILYVLEQEAAAIVGSGRSHIPALLGIATKEQSSSRFVLDPVDRFRMFWALDKGRRILSDVYELERLKGDKHAVIMRYNLNIGEK